MKKKTIAIAAAIALVALAVPAVAFANAMPHAWMGLGQSARVQPVLADQEANAARWGLPSTPIKTASATTASTVAAWARATSTPTATASATTVWTVAPRVPAMSTPMATVSATTAVPRGTARVRAKDRARARASVWVAEPVAATGTGCQRG